MLHFVTKGVCGKTLVFPAISRERFQIDYLNEQENSEYGDKDLEKMGEKPISSEKIEEFAKRINERIKAKESTNRKENTDKTKQKSNKKEKEQEKTEKKILRTLEKDCIPRLKKYEEQ